MPESLRRTTFFGHRRRDSDSGKLCAEVRHPPSIEPLLTNKAKKKKMDAAWAEGFEANSPGEYTALEGRVKTFMDYFGDMKEGDVIECTVRPGKGTHVTLNSDDKGIIEGDDFGTALLRVWLGPKPPTEELKKSLLGAI